MPTAEVSLNRIFLGNPGTGKTTVARLYGQILKSLGLLSVGEVVLATPSDLIGSALGQSEEKTNALLDKSQGCVLVIDEAYGLDPTNSGSFASVGGPAGGGGGGDPFKTAVIDTLVSRVQGDAGADRCVLLLGYRKEMERFIRRGNPGLARRFQLRRRLSSTTTTTRRCCASCCARSRAAARPSPSTRPSRSCGATSPRRACAPTLATPAPSTIACRPRSCVPRRASRPSLPRSVPRRASSCSPISSSRSRTSRPVARLRGPHRVR